MIEDTKKEIFQFYNKDWRHVNEYLEMKNLPIIKETGNLNIKGFRRFENFYCQKTNTIEFLEENVYIAGGCALSAYNENYVNISGLYYNDIDIFIVEKDLENYMKKYNNLLNYFKNLELVVSISEYKYLTEFELKYKKNNYGFIKIQIIKTNFNSVSDLLSKFDISACKILMDSNVNYYYTPDFKYALQTTSIGTNYKKIYSLSYFIRIYKYYQKGFKTRWPDFNEKFITEKDNYIEEFKKNNIINTYAESLTTSNLNTLNRYIISNLYMSENKLCIKNSNDTIKQLYKIFKNIEFQPIEFVSDIKYLTENYNRFLPHINFNHTPQLKLKDFKNHNCYLIYLSEIWITDKLNIIIIQYLEINKQFLMDEISNHNHDNFKFKQSKKIQEFLKPYTIPHLSGISEEFQQKKISLCQIDFIYWALIQWSKKYKSVLGRFPKYLFKNIVMKIWF